MNCPNKLHWTNGHSLHRRNLQISCTPMSSHMIRLPLTTLHPMGQWKDSSKPSSRQRRLTNGVASSRLRTVRHSKHLSKSYRWTTTNSITTRIVTYTRTSACNTCKVQLITTKYKVTQRLKHTYTHIPTRGWIVTSASIAELPTDIQEHSSCNNRIITSINVSWEPIHTRFDLLHPNVGRRNCTAQANQKSYHDRKPIYGSLQSVQGWWSGIGGTNLIELPVLCWNVGDQYHILLGWTVV